MTTAQTRRYCKLIGAKASWSFLRIKKRIDHINMIINSYPDVRKKNREKVLLNEIETFFAMKNWDNTVLIKKNFNWRSYWQCYDATRHAYESNKDKDSFFSNRLKKALKFRNKQSTVRPNFSNT